MTIDNPLYVKEIWKPTRIPDLYGSSLGRLKYRGLIKAQRLSPKGYRIITIKVYPGRKTYLSHTLIAEAHIPNPNRYNTIDHIDRDKTNNSISNLRWCTRAFNTKREWEEPNGSFFRNRL